MSKLDGKAAIISGFGRSMGVQEETFYGSTLEFEAHGEQFP